MTTRQYHYIFYSFLFFVVYGSLVPLDYNGLSFNEGIDRFLNIPWLSLGAHSRADWIANILLYIPLSFLLLSRQIAKTKKISTSHIISTTMICIGVAIFVEFLQTFFPPRTVSLNDLLAESIGTFIGIFIAIRYWSLFDQFIENIKKDSSNIGLSLLKAYTLAYIALSLFPFDFVTSFFELEQKMQSHTTALFFADTCGSLLSCIMKLAMESLLIVPVGLLFAHKLKHQSRTLITMATLGLLIGILLETTQIFIISAISQGISVFSRLGGFIFAYFLFKHRQDIINKIDAINIKPFILLAIPFYLFALIYVNKWLQIDWKDTSYAIQSFKDTNFLPFYYHYYTTETVAVVSVIFNSLIYASIGIAFALWNTHKIDSKLNLVILVTFILTAFIEFAKLFQLGTHMDPSNFIIAIISSTICYSLCRQLLKHNKHYSTRSAVNTMTKKTTTTIQPKTPKETTLAIDKKMPIPFTLTTAIGMILTLTSLAIFFSWPVAPVSLVLFSIVFFAAQFFYRLSWLYVLPFILLVLDLTPWSGRFFFDESDIFLMGMLGVMLITQVPYTLPSRKPQKLLLSLLVVIWTIATLIPLIPFSDVGINSFNNPFSPLHALKIAKGFYWAILFSPFLIYAISKSDAQLAFLRGLVIGAIGLTSWVVIERQLFSGLFNFSNDFRITASASSMHTGGGHIEIYLVVLIPFMMLWMLKETQFKQLKWFIGSSIVLGLLYALVVTYARAGYGAFAISMVVMGVLYGIGKSRSFQLKRLMAIAVPSIAVSGLFLVLVFQSSYVQQRMDTTSESIDTRTNHWRNSIRMMPDNLATTLFGMGLGQYPTTYAYFNNDDIKLASYQFVNPDNPHLNITAGDTLYYEQIIDLEPNQNYQIQLDVKSNMSKGSVMFPICEKAMLYSFQCEWLGVEYNHPENTWQRKTVDFSSKQLGNGNWYNNRPLKISLYNPTPDSSVLIDNIKILDSNNHNIIRNGDFSQTNDHWFFSTDNHLPWHTKQLAVQVYFSQGLVGLVIFIVFLIVVLRQVTLSALSGNSMAITLLSAITAYLLIGLFASPFDAPRLTFIFYSMMFMGYALNNNVAKKS